MSEDREMLQSKGDYMMAEAMKIPAKIAGAEGGDLYCLRMENAPIIRKWARNTFVSYNHFLIEDFKETEYLGIT